MKKALLLVAALAFSGCATTGSKSSEYASYKTYGATVPVEKAVPLDVALAKATVGQQAATVKAPVDSVCKNMGCWMKLKTASGEAMRVRFTASEECSDGFFVPRNANGHEAVVTGTLELKDISVEAAKHYAMEAGAAPQDVAKIKEGYKEYVMIATGVMLSDAATLDAPVGSEEHTEKM